MIVLNLLAISIGIGLLVTLILVEAFGLAAGGLVVPGYMALKVLQPWSVGLTLLAQYVRLVVRNPDQLKRWMCTVAIIFNQAVLRNSSGGRPLWPRAWIRSHISSLTYIASWYENQA